MTWLDSAIGWLNPQAGYRRAAWRSAAEQARAYDGARRDHRTTSWHATGGSANAEIGSAEEIVRNRSRDLVRNNGYARTIVETLADHIVGTGIVTAPTGLRGRNLKAVQQLYTDFVDYCDFEQDQDLNGLTWSAVQAMGESGAALIRFRRQQFDARTTTVPLRLQLLEPDFIDPTKNGFIGGNLVDRGIEYDADGRRVAFWLYDHHPGDVAAFRARLLVSNRVPANEVAYLFDKLRPGQDRGMPVLAPAIMALQDLRSYFDAELVRKRIGACMVGVITTTDENGARIGTRPSDPKPTYGPQTQKMEPGMWTRLLPGEGINFNSLPSDASIDMVATQFLRQIAAAGGVMYEHATGDFSHVNYSSWRAGHHGFRRRMERKQWNIAVHKACTPISARFTEAANAAGLLPALPGWRHTPPGFISVDPYKDAQADLLNLRMGKTSLPQLVEERGYDYVEFLKSYADGLKQADEAFANLGDKVMFDGDPRKAPKAAAPNSNTANEPNAANAA